MNTHNCQKINEILRQRSFVGLFNKVGNGGYFLTDTCTGAVSIFGSRWGFFVRFCELCISLNFHLIQYTVFENLNTIMPACLNNNGNLRFSRMV